MTSDNFPTFDNDNKSLLKKYLTIDMFNKLKSLNSGGCTINDIIKSGVENQDSNIGVYAGNYNSYTVFGELFYWIIKDYHQYDSLSNTHKCDFNVANLNINDHNLYNKYIISSRIRIARNIKNFNLSPFMSIDERHKIEKLVKNTLNFFNRKLSGKYTSINSMTDEKIKHLIENHLLFKKGDRFLESAGCNKDYPNGRGLFQSDDNSLLIWVNEEDHLRIISMEKGFNLKSIFSRLVDAIKLIERKIKFQYNDKIGFITACPSNLGTTMRASVHIKLPLLSREPKFKEIVNNLELDIRGIDGEHSESKESVYDISNKKRLGLSEVDCVNTLYNGIVKLIELEKMLESKLILKNIMSLTLKLLIFLIVIILYYCIFATYK
jgi:protein-arginine kinase